MVDGNWGVHADIEKWMFEEAGSYTPYQYETTASRRRSLLSDRAGGSRRSLLELVGLPIEEAPKAASALFDRVTRGTCHTCASSHSRSILGEKMLDAKLRFVESWQEAQEVPKHLRELLEKAAHPNLADSAAHRMSHAVSRTKRLASLSP